MTKFDVLVTIAAVIMAAGLIQMMVRFYPLNVGIFGGSVIVGWMFIDGARHSGRIPVSTHERLLNWEPRTEEEL